MIPSNWKTRPDRPAVRYRNGGDELSDDLFDLIGTYFVEVSRVIGDRTALRIYEDARVLDTVRLNYIRGEIDAEDAQLWLQAGQNHLQSIIRERFGSAA